ncbi:hypothetical protein HDV01_005736 [Terramyces sp. JEL0728]|nr:hypothetical protein HDV01_005736 [Terramyces sp. JEL0728]
MNEEYDADSDQKQTTLSDTNSIQFSLASEEEYSGETEIEKTNLKNPIIKSLFKGDDVLYFPKENETDAVKNAGFEFVTAGDQWLGTWGKHLPLDKFKKFHSWQKVNHFPMSFEIGRKDKMYQNYAYMRQRYPHDFDYVPESYILPSNRKQLDRKFSNSSCWILKPPASARGIGIKIVSKMLDIPRKKEFICSKYISNPLLINSRKFDLRLYVLVSSFDPLKIYIYKHGLARFASEKYSDTLGKKSKYRFSHLTNYSVNKKNKKINCEEGIFQTGRFSMAENKWSLETLESYFELNQIDYQSVMKNIHSLIIKTVMSAHSPNVSGVRNSIPNKTGCFELFGFDVLLDDTLKPWLMEVNISPAMKGSCDMDFKLKSSLIVDIFNTIGIKMKDVELARNHIKKKVVVGNKVFLSVSERIKHRSVLLGEDVLSNLLPDDLRVLCETEDEVNPY